MLINRCALVPQVIRTNDCGVTPGVAATQPSLVQHANIADAVLGGEIVRRGQPMAAGADDHDIVSIARFRGTPLFRPRTTKGTAQQGPGREMHRTNHATIVSAWTARRKLAM